MSAVLEAGPLYCCIGHGVEWILARPAKDSGSQRIKHRRAFDQLKALECMPRYPRVIPTVELYISRSGPTPSFGTGTPGRINNRTRSGPSSFIPQLSLTMDANQSKYVEEKDVAQASVHASISEKEVTEDARLATSREHNLSVRQGIKAYKKAIGWSILMSSAVIMEGYDTILVSVDDHDDSPSDAHVQIGSYLGFGSFNNTFGNQIVEGEPSITAPWQSAGRSNFPHSLRPQSPMGRTSAK